MVSVLDTANIKATLYPPEIRAILAPIRELKGF
jgi:hypothetical protein